MLVATDSFAVGSPVDGLLAPVNEKLKPEVDETLVIVAELLVVAAPGIMVEDNEELTEETAEEDADTVGIFEIKSSVLGISGSFEGKLKPSLTVVFEADNAADASLDGSLLLSTLSSFFGSANGLITACMSPDSTDVVVVIGNFVDSPNLKLETVDAPILDTDSTSVETNLAASSFCPSLLFSFSSSESDSSNASAIIALTLFSFCSRSLFRSAGLDNRGF